MTDPNPYTPAGHTTGRQQNLTLSEEIISIGTEWTEAGRVRLRRRIITETQTLEVTVRREELVIDTDDTSSHEQTLIGTCYDGPAIPPPSAQDPIRIVLQQEVPVVSLQLAPYELITVTTTLHKRDVDVHEHRQREQLELDQPD